MSHELRTPLNAIIGFSSILIESARGALQPRLYRFLENIHTAGSHLLDLINDILDLAKIESGKLDLRFETFELRDTIATVERVIKGMAAERRVSVITSIDENVGSVHLDEGRLKQILLNLLSNAVKFSNDAGFVYLNVRSEEADTIRFDVTDAGTGIAAAELTRIFDEFYQVHDPARRQKGTGLGLSLTKNFVEMHHGRISVKSEPGEGSTFTILLPRDARAAPAPPPARAPAPHRANARAATRTSSRCTNRAPCAWPASTATAATPPRPRRKKRTSSRAIPRSGKRPRIRRAPTPRCSTSRRSSSSSSTRAIFASRRRRAASAISRK
jgi:two-component sensor histidine kinase